MWKESRGRLAIASGKEAEQEEKDAWEWRIAEGEEERDAVNSGNFVTFFGENIFFTNIFCSWSCDFF